MITHFKESLGNADKYFKILCTFILWPNVLKFQNGVSHIKEHDHEHHPGSPKRGNDALITSACYEMRHVSVVTCPEDSSMKSNVLTT